MATGRPIGPTVGRSGGQAVGQFGRKSRRTDGRTVGQRSGTDGRTVRHASERSERSGTDGRTEGRMDGRTGGRTDSDGNGRIEERYGRSGWSGIRSGERSDGRAVAIFCFLSFVLFCPWQLTRSLHAGAMPVAHYSAPASSSASLPCKPFAMTRRGSIFSGIFKTGPFMSSMSAFISFTMYSQTILGV